MSELDITFEETAWEQAIEAAPYGSTLSATQLLTLLEDASEEQVEEALRLLRQKQITLDVCDIPVLPSVGEGAVRLRQEQQLAEKGELPSGLPEGDPLRLYLEELAAIPVAGDPRVLATELAGGNESVREQLANLMLHNTVSLSREFVGRGVLLLDLLQEAALGLWESLICYEDGDVEPHCCWWIRQYLAGAVMQQARISGMGQKLRQAMEDYRSVDERLLSELGRNPTMEEIAEGLHISLQEAETVCAMVANARMLNHVRQPEPEELPQEEDQAVEDTAYFQMRQRVQDLLTGLSQEDAKLLTLRYGLEGGLPLDPAQVGIKMGLTPQEVINREAAALAKLRQ